MMARLVNIDFFNKVAYKSWLAYPSVMPESLLDQISN